MVLPRGVPGISTASLTGRVLKFKFVKKYCLVDYIQQITVTQVTTVQTFSIKTTSKNTNILLSRKSTLTCKTWNRNVVILSKQYCSKTNNRSGGCNESGHIYLLHYPPLAITFLQVSCVLCCDVYKYLSSMTSVLIDLTAPNSR